MGVLVLKISEVDILETIPVEINGVLTHHGLQAGSFRISHLAEHRATAQFSLLATNELLGPWGIPFWGRKIEAWDSDGEKIFGGTIDEVRQSMRVAGDTSQAELAVECLCTDWNQVLDTLYLTGVFEAMTAGAAITKLFMAAAGEYSPCPKLSGIASEGFTLAEVDPGADLVIEIVDPPKTVAEFLDRMAELSKDEFDNSYTWYVDPDKGVHFVPRSVADAPFNLSDSDGNLAMSSFSLLETRKDYANEILMRFGAGVIEEQIEFTGDNISRVFPRPGADPPDPLIKPMRELVRVELNGVTQQIDVEPETDNPGADWYWRPAGTSIRQAAAAPAAISTTDVLTVVYRALFSDVIGAINEDEIARYAMLTAGSGKLQTLIERTELTDADVIIQTVNRLRDKISSQGREISFRTYRAGLMPGQLIRVTLAAHALVDEQFVIDRVEIQEEDKTRLVYSVTAYGVERIRNAIDFFQDLARAGGGGDAASFITALGDTYDITVILPTPEIGNDIATHLPINTRGKALDWRLTAVTAPASGSFRARVMQNGSVSLFDSDDAVLPSSQGKSAGSNVADLELVPGDYVSADVISTGGAENVTLRVRVKKT